MSNVSGCSFRATKQHGYVALFHVVLANRANERGLRALVADGFRKSHFFADMQAIVVAVLDTIPVEVDLTAIG